MHSGAEASLTPTWRRATGYYDYGWGFRESERPDPSVLPAAVESIEQPSDTEFVVRLASARFHNQPANDFNDEVGQREIDSEDLTELLDFVKVPPASLVQRLTDDLTVEAIDAKTLRYRLTQPYAFVYEAGNPIFLPKELLDESILKTQPPLGTGPYMYKSHTLGSIEEAVRTRITSSRTVPTSTVRRSRRCRTPLPSRRRSSPGRSTTWVRQRAAARRSRRRVGDDINPRDYPSSSGMALLLNIRRQPFTDIRIREAIHRAIDVQQVVGQDLFGDASRSWVFAAGRPDRFPIGYGRSARPRRA